MPVSPPEQVRGGRLGVPSSEGGKENKRGASVDRSLGEARYVEECSRYWARRGNYDNKEMH